jgi:hypothetical protein
MGIEREVQTAPFLIVPGIRDRSVSNAIQSSFKKWLQFSLHISMLYRHRKRFQVHFFGLVGGW